LNLASIQVRFGADTSGFSSAINRMKQETGGLTSGIKSMLGSALSFAAGQAIFNVVGDAVHFLGDQFKACLAESAAAAVELAQTNAVLKSTKDASGQTAQSVLNLADKFSHLTMFSDDAVQSAENILLTFTSIGKNIFPQATQATLDLSQAMGQDWKTSAIQVGKALNDPLHGLTNLQRIGVSFSQTQKDMIKQFMATGDVLDAQKIILGELNREFGNSAIAAGKTLPGQLKILGQNFDDVRQTIGDAVQGPLKGFVAYLNSQVVPALKAGAKWVADFLGAMGKSEAQKALGDLGKAFGDLGGAINNIIGIFLPLGVHIGSAKNAAHNFSEAIKGVAGFIKGLAGDINAAKPTIVAIKAWLEEAARKIAAAWQDMQPTFKSALSILQQVGNFLRDTFAPVWAQLQGTIKALKPSWDQLVAAIKPAMPALQFIGTVLGGVVVGGLMLFAHFLAIAASGAVLAFGLIAAGVTWVVTNFLKFLATATTVVNTVKSIWNGIPGFFSGLWSGIVGIFSGAIKTVVGWFQWLYDHNYYFKQLVDTIRSVVGSVVSWLTTAWHNVSTTLAGVWQTISQKAGELWNTIGGIFKNAYSSHISGPLSGLAKSIGDWASNLAKSAWQWGKNVIQGIIDGINNMLGAVKTAAGNVAAAIAKALGFHSPPPEGPAADSDTWAPNFVKMFARGLRAGIPDVRAAFGELLGGMGSSLSVSHSFSGSGAAPVAFGGFGGGSPVIINHNVIQCDGHPVYLDGRLVTEQIGPHLAYSMRFQTGNRRPA
jgi:phage-related protein